ncbi:hypothetical protein A9Q99_15200 [Gammaproteobacteria bacterium 45_16_T64]|nr:hypothetical protein A9Q99_15200 [Gammaproteobacteria bacterium 45_16_T64]
MYKQLIALTAATSLTLAGCSMFGGDKPDAAPAPAAPIEQTTAEPSLLEQIDSDISGWRLTSPKGNNAAEKLAHLRKIDPTNTAIPTIESKIIGRYVELANRVLNKKKVASTNSLKKAQRFINTARDISPNSEILNRKEKEISDLLDISKQRDQLQQAKMKSAAKKEAAARAQREAEAEQAAAEKQQSEELAALKTQREQEETQLTREFDPSKPPSSMMMKMAPKPASTDNLLVFNQIDVDNQSQSLGLEIDNLSRRIIEKDAKVIVHAKSEKDYRWINGSLKTSIYLMSSEFNLESSPKIGESEHPSIEIVE